jgi:hypothetical protein
MRDHDDRLQQQRHGPHAEQPLEHHEREQRGRRARRLRGITAVAPSDDGERDADQAERARKITVDHLAPSFAGLERTRVLAELARRCRRIGHHEPPVAAGPVGTAEPGVGQAHPRAEHDDDEGQHGAGARQPNE